MCVGVDKGVHFFLLVKLHFSFSTQKSRNDTFHIILEVASQRKLQINEDI